jgi:hypothetical protein
MREPIHPTSVLKTVPKSRHALAGNPDPTCTITVRLLTGTRDVLAARATAEGKTVSAFTRGLIEWVLSKYSSPP